MPWKPVQPRLDIQHNLEQRALAVLVLGNDLVHHAQVSNNVTYGLFLRLNLPQSLGVVLCLGLEVPQLLQEVAFSEAEGVVLPQDLQAPQENIRLVQCSRLGHFRRLQRGRARLDSLTDFTEFYPTPDGVEQPVGLKRLCEEVERAGPH